MIAGATLSDAGMVGGKARALIDLEEAGFQIPRFFVAVPDTPPDEILGAYDGLFPDHARVAVRSSAVGEDGAEHSFAGQYETFLSVPREEVVERCRRVWASGDSERVQAYESDRGATGGAPAALVQRMVIPDHAGVAFSADPVTGRRSVAVVAAVRGLGERLVSGESDAETWEVDTEGTVIRVAEGEGSLTEAQAAAVAELARACEVHYNHPQDIEWAIHGEDLWLLQSRPVTSLRGLPDPGHPLRIWDNSNIAESYPGVSTPLTYTFARRAYEHVYRQFCRAMAVPRGRIDANGVTFSSMIAQIRGRIYYNLVSWYRVLAMLPGFRLNRAFMEQMMGVKEPMPEAVVAAIEAENRGGKLYDALCLWRTVTGLVWQHLRLPGEIRRFFERLHHALAEAPANRDDYAWIAHYRELESQLLKRWDAPLVNDFFAMLFSGVFRKLSAKWCEDESGELANRLLQNLGEIISAEPARRIREMAARQAVSMPIDNLFEAYLDEFGDRCFEELKLESPTLRDDPSPLRTSIDAFAERIRAGARVREAEPLTPDDLPALPWPKRIVFQWVLRQARQCVRNRENLRFERTRVFGRVRQVMRLVGARLAERGIIDAPEDVFYLHLEEILAHYENTSAQRLSPELVRMRREEWEGYRREPAPPDRFQTHGPPAAYESFEDLLAHRHVEMESASSLQGVGACAGVVRGRVRVVHDPRQSGLQSGEILVALQTDPGWVVLFPSAAGLLVERGSLLSHSAIVAREMNIPAVVSIPSVTRILQTGQEVEMNGTSGEVRILSEAGA